MALLSALCVGLNALGFTNRSLRAQVSHLLGVPTNSYTLNQASYDLARLRLNGLIERREHSNTYDLTPDGQRVAIFYTKVHDRLPRPLIAADQPPAPPALRLALRTVDEHVHSYIAHARLERQPGNSRPTSEFGSPRNARTSKPAARRPRGPAPGRAA